VWQRLCCGYPDLLVTKAQLVSLLGPERAARVAMRADSREILAWHGVKQAFEGVFDARATFAQLGFTLDVVDIAAARGDEIILDLNRPLPASFTSRYDLVIDTGTCEHCFHIGQAAMNLSQLVRKGGYVVQALPLNSFNHGFYNVNPTWFHDFYPANWIRDSSARGDLEYRAGAEILRAAALRELFHRFRTRPSRVLVAQRIADVEPIVPTQRKYVESRISRGPLAKRPSGMRVRGVCLGRLAGVREARGRLVAAQAGAPLPFVPRRCFVIMDVPNRKIRGEHAHRS
jgi:hypothetical protein